MDEQMFIIIIIIFIKICPRSLLFAFKRTRHKTADYAFIEWTDRRKFQKIKKI